MFENARNLQPAPPPRRGWRAFRVTFRWCRIALLLALLFTVILGLFLNHVGLPEPVKRRVIARLRDQGWDVQFSRLRLRWYRGVVAEDLQLHRTNLLEGPNLFVEEAECRFNHKAFRHFDFEVDSVLLQNGRLIWFIAQTNQPTRHLLLDDLAGEVRFRASDAWEFQGLRGRVLGARMHLSGTITNASMIRDWKLARRVPGIGAAFWNRLMSELGKVKFTGQPEVIAEFGGDAREFRSFAASLRLIIPRVQTPWGQAAKLFLHTRLMPALRDTDSIRAAVKLSAYGARTPWAEAGTLDAETTIAPSWARLFPTNASARFELTSVKMPWGQAARVRAELESHPSATNDLMSETQIAVAAEDWWHEQERAASASLRLKAFHHATNYLPADVSGTLRLTKAQTRWAGTPGAEITFHALLPPTNNFHLLETNLSWPERIEGVPIELTAVLRNVDSPKLKIDTVVLTNYWRAPMLRLTLESDFSGQTTAFATLNATNHELFFAVTNDFEPEKLQALLSRETKDALPQWKGTPRVSAEGHVVLPALTNPHFSQELWQAISATGRVDSGAGEYRGFGFESLQAPFVVTNLVWQFCNATLGRPEGAILASGKFDSRTFEFQSSVDSSIDLKALKPIFPRRQEQRVFDLFQFNEVPRMQAEFRGRWGDLRSVGFNADVQLTNGAFRGEQASGCTARIEFTNRFVSVIGPHLWHTYWHGTADGIGVDLADERLYLTNAHGTIDPYALTRAIGPAVARAIGPFQFGTPPTARVSGMVDLTARRHDDNMRFEIEGGPFQWLHFQLDRVKGLIHWQGNDVVLTNIAGALKGAGLAGDARFNFSHGSNPLFSFSLALVEADLKAMGANLTSTTNRLEGLLDGTLTITSAQGNDPKSWQGQGYAHLRDGLIWEVPIFGIFSPALDAIYPGLGRSRAKEATADFTITNSVIHTRHLEIRATAMRMVYQGMVDFDRNVDGRMEAELLRDVPAIGVVMQWLFAPVTKLFIYKVTGTLDKPKKEPLYIIPRILLVPLHPIKTARELFGSDERKSEEKPAEK